MEKKREITHKKNKKILEIESKSYEETWEAFTTKQIHFEKFEEVLNQLLADNKITQVKYEHGLNKAKKFKKILCAFGEL